MPSKAPSATKPKSRSFGKSAAGLWKKELPLPTGRRTLTANIPTGAGIWSCMRGRPHYTSSIHISHGVEMIFKVIGLNPAEALTWIAKRAVRTFLL